MNLKQLEAFVRVAETKSFSAAAKQLYLTQPTVSAHIASLERELNTCLLVRNTKGVALSESGKELYAYAEHWNRRYATGSGLRGNSRAACSGLLLPLSRHSIFSRISWRSSAENIRKNN